MSANPRYLGRISKCLLQSIFFLIFCTSVSQQFSINREVDDFLDLELLENVNHTQYLSDLEKLIASIDRDVWIEASNDMLDLPSRYRKTGRINILPTVNCLACKSAVTWSRTMMKIFKKSDEEIANTVSRLCSILHIQQPGVCSGALALVGVEAFYVMRHSKLSTKQLCNWYLGGTCMKKDDPDVDWKLNFPPKPKPSQHPTVPPKETAPKLKVLQISDTHYDPYYLEGANAECNEPICCRALNGPPSSSAAAAGKWGDYRLCDAPKWLVEDTFRHIADTHKDIDYVIWTGDLPPHDIWNQTREENLRNLRETVEMVHKHFKDVPVFPSIGNHESAPVNSFAPEYGPAEKNMSWLYTELDKEWSRWLPAETSPTIRYGAFYSTLARPGLRIIAVNSNFCNRRNYWIALSNSDPLNQLDWLIKELQAAEDKGEKVHIISHIPPGNPTCVKVWSRNYYDIINRYEGTIMAQFYGHTHVDEFEVFYDTADLKRAINVGYIAPSITPWEGEGVNPAYRIYYVDGDHSETSRSIIDHETWQVDLDKANKYGNTVWYKEYTAREAYQMPSALPKDWDDLIHRMSQNRSLFDIFYRNSQRAPPQMPECNKKCQKKMLCNLKSGRSYDEKNLCKEL